MVHDVSGDDAAAPDGHGDAGNQLDYLAFTGPEGFRRAERRCQFPEGERDVAAVRHRRQVAVVDVSGVAGAPVRTEREVPVLLGVQRPPIGL